MSTNDWLAQLKAGDTVITVNSSGKRGIDTVRRGTRTQVLLSHTDRRFRRSNGGEVGGGTWTAWQIDEGTPEAVAAVRTEHRHRTLASKFRDCVAWSCLPLSVLEQVNAVLESHNKEGSE